MQRAFVVVSGLPGSGKSTIAAGLSRLLRLSVIDKDEILECLFHAKGVGDLGWRRALSRESDLLFRAEAEASNGAILVSFWQLAGMPPDSGTPTDWLRTLCGQIVNVHCECPPAVAAARYKQRRRHPGHLDDLRSHREVLTSIESLAEMRPMEIGTRVRCDTSQEVDLQLLARAISDVLGER